MTQRDGREVGERRRILLTGRSGQVGAELLPLLARLGEVIAPGREEMDLLVPESVRRIIRKTRPEAIVNAAAYTAVDRAEAEEVTARAVNADAPALMAEEARKIGAAMVHYSTDYVFDGTKGAPYAEDDAPAPASAYGRTKLAGEEAIRGAGIAHLILRTEWVYAARGKNFVRTVLRLASERDELRIVADQTGSPTWSREIARATAKILGQALGSGAEGRLEGISGTYHMTAAGETTWFGFAEAILAECGRAGNAPWIAEATSGRGVVARRVVAIGTGEYPTPARRPACSVLDNAKLLKNFGCALPHWRGQLEAMFRGG